MKKLSYYQLNKKRCLEAQWKYRHNPKRREAYLARGRERSKNWYQIPGNRERRYKYNRDWWQKRVKELEKIAGRPRPNNCEICKEKEKIMFDHDHKTGKFRGWICMNCNTVLGKVKDNKELLKSLIKYLD